MQHDFNCSTPREALMTDAQNQTHENNRQGWDQWFENQRKAVDVRLETLTRMQGEWDHLTKAWQHNMQSPDPLHNPPQLNDLAKMMADQGAQYMALMAQFMPNGQAAPAQTQAPFGNDLLKQWADGLQRFFEDSVRQEAQSHTTWNAQSWNAKTWGARHGFDPAAQFRNFTGGFAQQAQNRFGAAAFPDPLSYFAEMPGVGYSREQQEELGELYQRFTEYQKASQAYNLDIAKTSLVAVARFQEYLRNPPPHAQPLTTLKAVYAKWIDCCEEVFAHYAVTPHYTKIYGESVNALMRFKQAVNKQAEKTAAAFNMPTRSEIDSLHQRMHELRRENASLRAEVRGGGKPAAVKSAPVKAAPAKAAPASPKAAKKPAPKKTAAKGGKK